MTSTQKQATIRLAKALFPYLLVGTFALWLIMSPSKSSTSSSTCFSEHWNSSTQKMSPTVFLYMQQYPGLKPGQIAAAICDK